MEMNWIVIGIIIGVISVIFIFLILLYLPSMSCGFNIGINSALRINLKNFFRGLPPIVSGFFGFGGRLFNIQEGWNPCVYSINNPDTKKIPETILYDSMSCWNAFGKGGKDYLEGENPVIDCYVYTYEMEDTYRSSSLFNYFESYLASEEGGDVVKTNLKVLFVTNGENDRAVLITNDNPFNFEGHVEMIISYLDWVDYNTGYQISQMLEDCYMDYDYRVSTRSSSGQPSFFTFVAPKEYDCISSNCYVPLGPVDWFDNNCHNKECYKGPFYSDCISCYTSSHVETKAECENLFKNVLQNYEDGSCVGYYPDGSLNYVECYENEYCKNWEGVGECDLDYAFLPSYHYILPSINCFSNNDDGMCLHTYTPCGYLDKSLACCEDKIIVCLRRES